MVKVSRYCISSFNVLIYFFWPHNGPECSSTIFKLKFFYTIFVELHVLWLAWLQTSVCWEEEPATRGSTRYHSWNFSLRKALTVLSYIEPLPFQCPWKYVCRHTVFLKQKLYRRVRINVSGFSLDILNFLCGGRWAEIEHSRAGI